MQACRSRNRFRERQQQCYHSGPPALPVNYGAEQQGENQIDHRETRDDVGPFDERRASAGAHYKRPADHRDQGKASDEDSVSLHWLLQVYRFLHGFDCHSILQAIHLRIDRNFYLLLQRISEIR